MSTDPVRDLVTGRKAAGTALHLSAGPIAELCQVGLREAVASLEALALEGLVQKRVWVLCSDCGQPLAVAEPPSPDDPNYAYEVEQDPEGTRRAACTSCAHCHGSSFGRDPAGPPTLVCWVLQGTRPDDLYEVEPGPELDLLVAEALGLVPCDAWEPVNFGSAGGPGLMSCGCYHESGACYPTVENGRAGGLPPFSRPAGRKHHAGVTLDDLPPDTSLSRNATGGWVVRLHGGTPAVGGSTEPHVLSLAVLVAARKGTLTPRYTESTRWRSHWPKVAVEHGIVFALPTSACSLPAPWTPRLVLALDDLLRSAEDDGRYDEAVRLEQTRPRKQQMMFGSRSRMGRGEPSLILKDILDAARASGGERLAVEVLAFLTAATEAAAKKGYARARTEFDWRTEQLRTRGS